LNEKLSIFGKTFWDLTRIVTATSLEKVRPTLGASVQNLETTVNCLKIFGRNTKRSLIDCPGDV
jgi:hypothetical protein